MTSQTFRFTGLHCEACVKLITKKLLRLPGVTSVQGDETGTFAVSAQRTIPNSEVAQLFDDTEYSLNID